MVRGREVGVRTPRLTEKMLQAAVEDCARVLGYLVSHPRYSIASAPGFPDLVLAKAWRPGGTGRVIFAELKTGRRKLTLDQDDWICALRQCPGVEVYVWREADWLDGIIERVLRGEV
jgi:hypothetical protein